MGLTDEILGGDTVPSLSHAERADAMGEQVGAGERADRVVGRGGRQLGAAGRKVKSAQVTSD